MEAMYLSAWSVEFAVQLAYASKNLELMNSVRSAYYQRLHEFPPVVSLHVWELELMQERQVAYAAAASRAGREGPDLVGVSDSTEVELVGKSGYFVGKEFANYCGDDGAVDVGIAPFTWMLGDAMKLIMSVRVLS